jgi:hypothetical protein
VTVHSTATVYIQGQGDPKLVLERLWLLLRRLQGMGIRSITGDIVLDRSAFEVPDTDPANFDGEPLRPYNAAPGRAADQLQGGGRDLCCPSPAARRRGCNLTHRWLVCACKARCRWAPATAATTVPR